MTASINQCNGAGCLAGVGALELAAAAVLDEAGLVLVLAALVFGDGVVVDWVAAASLGGVDFLVVGLELLVGLGAVAESSAVSVVASGSTLGVPRLRAWMVNGWVTMLGAPALGVVVQYHLPLASAQPWPSLAVS